VTTPAAIIAALQEAVRAASAEWRLIEQPEDLVSGEPQSGFRVLATGAPARVRATGLAGVQVLDQRFTVELHDVLAGDPAAEDPVFLEDAREVADSIEYSFGSYPAGTEAVLVESRGGVERKPNDATWATVRIVVRVVYQAAIGAAA
jgi:hypothetical protein